MDRQELIERINALKKEKNAVILAHYYANDEVQDIADFLGDSLGLSRLAAKTDADVIVFGGVHFMAETAAIISPDKKVLSPAFDAGCSLADSCTAEGLRKWKKEHPDGIVVSYVNTTAAVKAETDYCCTSANAIKVVEALPEDKEILFGPDRNLGAHIMQVTGRKMELWNGACFVHEHIKPEMVFEALEKYPDADILIHPEAKCANDPRLLSNPRIVFGSTTGMIRHATGCDRKRIVVGTELGTMHELKKKNPDKEFIPLSPLLRCYNMKKVTLENILVSLETGKGEVILDEEIRRRALLPIQRMMEIG